MSSHLADNSDHWRKRAGEMRRLAQIIVRPKPKEMVLRLAEDYERLAEQAAERMKKPAASSRH